MRRKIALFVIALCLALPGVSRADFVFKISQNVSSLAPPAGAASPPSPFFLFFNISSGDQGIHNNSATIYNFASTNVSLVGAPLVQQGNATGSLNGKNQLVVHEGITSTPGDSTNVYQQFAVTSPGPASISFEVLVNQNFAGTVGVDQADQFNYGIYYFQPNFPGDTPDLVNFGNIAPVSTGNANSPGGNAVFALYDFVPGSNFQSVQTFGPDGTNGGILDAIGPAIATPEPAGSLLWAVTACGVGGYYLRRRKIQLAESNV